MGVATVVIWPKVFEASRRVVLAVRLLGVDGQIQREGEVVHIVARRLHDLFHLFDSPGDREIGDARWGRDDDVPPGGKGDPHVMGPRRPRPRDSVIPDSSLVALRVKPREFR